MEDNIDIEKYAQKLRMELDEALGRNEELSEEISDHARMLEKTIWQAGWVYLNFTGISRLSGT